MRDVMNEQALIDGIYALNAQQCSTPFSLSWLIHLRTPQTEPTQN